MAYKVITNVDKFDNRASTEMNEEYKMSHGKLFIRYLSTSDTEGVFLDYYYDRIDSDFLYTAGGEMTIRINDMENIKLPFLGSGDRHSFNDFSPVNGRPYSAYDEYNWVSIDKTTLEKICEAKSVEIQAKGKYKEEYSADQCQGFIEYCRVYYNGLYKTNKYNIQGNLMTPKELEEKRIKKDEKKTNIALILFLLFIVGVIIWFIDSASDLL